LEKKTPLRSDEIYFVSSIRQIFIRASEKIKFQFVWKTFLIREKKDFNSFFRSNLFYFLREKKRNFNSSSKVFSFLNYKL